MLEIDTTNILFIAGGAFVGLENIISRRIDHNSIGFGSSIKNTSHKEQYLKHIIPDDLMAFGMIPEFTGRFANIVSISELSRHQLVEVLTKVKNNYIDQYKYLLSIDDIDLTFDDDVYELIADNCLKLKTGARGLHSEVERILLHVMYNTKYLQNKKINITHEHVSNPEKILLDYMDHQ
jgi:ATP-dependent Clp protease ATP-binding subunit ClpX